MKCLAKEKRGNVEAYELHTRIIICPDCGDRILGVYFLVDGQRSEICKYCFKKRAERAEKEWQYVHRNRVSVQGSM